MKAWLVLGALIVVLAAACGPTGSPTPLPTVVLSSGASPTTNAAAQVTASGRVVSAQEVHLAARMSPAPSRVSAYVAFVFSAAMLGAGLYFGLQSRQEQQDIEAVRRTGGSYASNDPPIAAGRTHAIAADALFGLGGITTLLGAYYALRNPGPDTTVERSARNFAVTPVVGPGGIGVTGRF